MFGKIVDKVWFPSSKSPFTIGIICVITDDGKRRAYVGGGLGRTEREDEELIAENGGKCNVSELKRVIEFLEAQK